MNVFSSNDFGFVVASTRTLEYISFIYNSEHKRKLYIEYLFETLLRDTVGVEYGRPYQELHDED